ncbi:ABC transporter ATP-binding protein [Halanaerobiaceae bacterium Z-7014]|uniref:ABC transporter ATP-binding protein n=1 Tax=Halonatronomonas betaini TaxID=2778430 RepID=A0A931APQ7_9FIRM|nr:ABC transporter ATP-binding protein [Halonatronomonas betaini]MBF8436202.1 ABC transporter ATP-binding protein [Halonatronomonas betaini]
MKDNVLEVKNLKAYYDIMKGKVKAVDDITFNLKKGEILGLAGESGCGKSTLASTFIYRKKPLKYISGEVDLVGNKIMEMREKEFKKLRLNTISLIPQYALDAFSPTKKVKQYIFDLARQHGVKTDKNFLNKVKERFELVNLDESTLNRYSIELSGGMKQRVIMVISTILDPDFLIADEITSALDVSSQRFVATMLANLRDLEIIKSAIFITHDISILYQIADRIMIMYAGNLAEIGPTDDIIDNPCHPYTRALIDSLPKVGVQYKDNRLSGIKGTPPHLLEIGEGCRFRKRCSYEIDECKETPKREFVAADHFVACWRWKELGSDLNGEK